MADEKQTFTVAGYKFATKEEAQDAKDELNAIKYLSSQPVALPKYKPLRTA